MRIPLEISFKNMEPTAAMESLVRERVERLKRFHRGIVACRVSVEAPHQSPNNEALSHRVRVEVSIPGDSVVVSYDHTSKYDEYDPYMAIRDSFGRAERQLKTKTGRKRRGRHPRSGPPHAVVFRIFGDDGYGFIKDGAGREIYFHENSVLNDHFDDLEVGQEVRFEETMGRQGPQATTVAPIGEHGSRTLTSGPPAPGASEEFEAFDEDDESEEYEEFEEGEGLGFEEFDEQEEPPASGEEPL